MICVCVWIMAPVLGTGVFAQETNSWKFFRGDKFDGHSSETGIVDNWSDKGPPVLWIKELGAGYSSFVGEAERVYTQYQSLSGQFVVCINAKNGETIWEHRYAWPYQPASLYPGPRSTPTISGGRVFFTSPSGVVGCLDMTTGEPIWSVDAAEKFGAPDVEFGYACSPVCIEGKVILPIGGPDASMVAFDETDGSVVWNAGNDQISYCSALPIELGGRKLIVGYFKNSLCIFDRADGFQLAKFKISFDYDEHSAWPIYREPYLWLSGPFRAGSQLFQLSSDSGSIRLKTVYKIDTMSNDVASSVLVGDELYGFDLRDVQSKVHRPSRGQFACIDFVSGQTRWTNGTISRRKLTDDEFVSSQSTSEETDVGHVSTLYADGKLILFNDTGELILCKAQPDSFVQLARTRILGGEICWVQPALMNRCVFVRNHSKAVCVYLGDLDDLGLPEDEIEFAAAIWQPEFIDLSAMILGTEPTYAMTAPKASWLTRWYFMSLLLGWVVAPLLAVTVSKMLIRIPARPVFLTLALTFGILGTTLYGRWLQEFYFSWPIVLLIAFECVICRLKNNDLSWNGRPWVARLTLVAFVLTCLGYFLLCRRLSLAFEWAFLIGFPVALPFLWFVKQSVQSGQRFNMKQWLGGAAAFTAFYWAGAGIMLWKYSS